MAFKKPRNVKEAKHQIESILKQAQLELESRGIAARRFVHVNRDGSIDGELSVTGKRGLPSDDLFFAMDESIPRESVGLWLSSGARFSAVKDEENYSRFKGLQQVQAYYQRYSRGKRAINVNTARQIVRRVEKNQRRKVTSGFVRIHWNRKDEKPTRKPRK